MHHFIGRTPPTTTTTTTTHASHEWSTHTHPTHTHPSCHTFATLHTARPASAIDMDYKWFMSYTAVNKRFSTYLSSSPARALLLPKMGKGGTVKNEHTLLLHTPLTHHTHIGASAHNSLAQSTNRRCVFMPGGPKVSYGCLSSVLLLPRAHRGPTLPSLTHSLALGHGRSTGRQMRKRGSKWDCS